MNPLPPFPDAALPSGPETRAPAPAPAPRAFASCEGSPRLDPPFTLGVAAGAPSEDGFVIWTRLAPDPLREEGGMPCAKVPVFWQVALDDEFLRIEQFGTVLALPESAHSVHVEVQNLAPSSVYFYRFHAAGYVSGRGAARTLPSRRCRVEALRVGLVDHGAQVFGVGPAYGVIARDDLDFVVGLDAVLPGAGCRAAPSVCTSSLLGSLRIAHARARLAPELQAAQRAFAWFHPDVPRSASPLTRQAYYEHTPMRARPSAGSCQVLGRLAELHRHEELREPSLVPSLAGGTAPPPRRRGATRWSLHLAPQGAETAAERAPLLRCPGGTELQVGARRGGATIRAGGGSLVGRVRAKEPSGDLAYQERVGAACHGFVRCDFSHDELLVEAVTAAAWDREGVEAEVSASCAVVVEPQSSIASVAPR